MIRTSDTAQRTAGARQTVAPVKWFVVDAGSRGLEKAVKSKLADGGNSTVNSTHSQQVDSSSRVNGNKRLHSRASSDGDKLAQTRARLPAEPGLDGLAVMEVVVVVEVARRLGSIPEPVTETRVEEE